MSVCSAYPYPIAVRMVSDEILIALGAIFNAYAQRSCLKIETRHRATVQHRSNNTELSRLGKTATCLSNSLPACPFFLVYIFAQLRGERRRGRLFSTSDLIANVNTCKNSQIFLQIFLEARDLFLPYLWLQVLTSGRGSEPRVALQSRMCDARAL